MMIIVLIAFLLLLLLFLYFIDLVTRKYINLLPKRLNSGDLIVSSVDLYKYKGKWYEIARLPNYFQGSDCTNPIAIYDLNSNNTISVKNQCGINNNISVQGYAIPLYPNLPFSNQIGNFKVYFKNLPIWLTSVGEYNIIFLDSDYQYAMVGTKDRKQLWLLSRSTNISKSQLTKMLEFAKTYGYPINKLISSSKITTYN